MFYCIALWLPQDILMMQTKTEKELEDLFKALVVKQKGMTDTLKGVVKRSTWDSDKMFKLIQESGNKTITKAQVDEANV